MKIRTFELSIIHFNLSETFSVVQVECLMLLHSPAVLRRKHQFSKKLSI